MSKSNIGWTHFVQNFWLGCTKISAGCANCYAEAQQDLKYHRVKWGKGQPRHVTKTWGEPLKWNREAQHLGIRYRVFTNSLADMFDEEVSDEMRDNAFSVIKSTPNLDWLILTKRVQKAADYLANLPGWPFTNVWLGASIEDQPAADYRLPILKSIPAKIKFLSVEPMLGDIRLFDIAGNWTVQDFDWVICGGESGEGFRRMEPKWAMRLYVQCETAKVAFYMKQGSGPNPETQGDIPNGLWDVKEFPI